MIIVSNASPIMNLGAIGQLELLKRLYGNIIIPMSVYHEISTHGTEQTDFAEIDKFSWIEVKSAANQNLVQSLEIELDEGESEAIALAVESNANLLLIDERKGRAVALRFGIRYMGILGILTEAKHRGFVKAIKPIMDDLISKAGFWISQRLYDHILINAGEAS